MSVDNPYSTPMANESNPEMVPTRKNSGFVIAICVVFILFGIYNVTINPCAFAMLFFGPEMIKNIIPEDDNSEEAKQMRQQMEQTKEMGKSPFVIVPLVASIFLGLGQLIASIAGFRRSQFGKSSIPMVAGLAILVSLVSIVCMFFQPTPPDNGLGGAQDETFQMIGIVMNVIFGVGFVVFYGIVVAFSMSGSYKAHFGEQPTTMYQ